MRTRIFALATVWCLSMTSVLAQKAEREFQVGDNPHLVLENISGNINISRGGDDTVMIRVFKNDDRIEVEMSQNGDRIRVKTIYPENNYRSNGGVDFEVQFPAEGELDIKSISGSISVDGVSGELDLKSVSGDVELTNLEGNINANSVSGNVVLTKIGNAEVDANSISGRIDYSRGSLEGGDYSFSSTSGSVKIAHRSDASYHISGRTISGRIRDKTGDLQIRKEKYTNMQSVSGEFNGGTVEVSANSVSGSITIEIE